MRNLFTPIAVFLLLLSSCNYNYKTTNTITHQDEIYIKADIINQNYDNVFLELNDIVDRNYNDNVHTFHLSKRIIKNVILTFAMYNIIDTTNSELILYNNIFKLKSSKHLSIANYNDVLFLSKNNNVGYIACKSFSDATIFYIIELNENSEIKDAKTSAQILKIIANMYTLDYNKLTNIYIKTSLLNHE